MLVNAIGNIWNIYLVSALQYSIFFLAAGSMSMRIREGQLVEVFLLRCGNFLFCSCVCCLATYVAFVIKNLLIPVGT